MQIMDLSFMVLTTSISTTGKHISKAIHRLALPRAHLIGMNLVSARYFLNGHISTQ